MWCGSPGPQQQQIAAFCSHFSRSKESCQDMFFIMSFLVFVIPILVVSCVKVMTGIDFVRSEGSNKSLRVIVLTGMVRSVQSLASLKPKRAAAINIRGWAQSRSIAPLNMYAKLSPSPMWVNRACRQSVGQRHYTNRPWEIDLLQHNILGAWSKGCNVQVPSTLSIEDGTISHHLRLWMKQISTKLLEEDTTRRPTVSTTCDLSRRIYSRNIIFGALPILGEKDVLKGNYWMIVVVLRCRHWDLVGCFLAFLPTFL